MTTFQGNLSNLLLVHELVAQSGCINSVRQPIVQRYPVYSGPVPSKKNWEREVCVLSEEEFYVELSRLTVLQCIVMVCMISAVICMSLRRVCQLRTHALFILIGYILKLLLTYIDIL